MTRVFVLVALAVAFADSVSAQVAAPAQVIAVFPTGTLDPNTAQPVTEFSIQPTCGVATRPANTGLYDRPEFIIWAIASTKDCEGDVRFSPIASLPPRAPDGYQAAARVNPSTFGPLSTSFLAAQNPPPTTTIEAGKPFRVQMDHDGLITTGYRLYIDNVQVGLDYTLAALSGGVVTTSSPGVSAGNHTAQISAFNGAGEVKSAPLTFQSTTPPPSAGTNTRISQP